MKKITLLLILFIGTSVTAQFRITSTDALEIAVPKNVKSYSIYCHSTSLGWLEDYKGQRVLIKKVLVKNGLETRITEFDGKKSVEFKITITVKGCCKKQLSKI